MRNDLCTFCGRHVEDYEPEYCCNGFMCGCQGMPIYPPEHKHCAVIDYLKRIKRFCEEDKKVSLSMTTSFPGVEVKIENHRKLISTEDINIKEGQHIMDCQGFTHGIGYWADFLIEKMDGSAVDDNSEKIECRSEILDL